MTQLTETIYAVTVPKDAKDFFIGDLNILQFNSKNWRGNHYEDGRCILVLPTPKDNWGGFYILGTVTSESIDFDVSGLVDSEKWPSGREYFNYEDGFYKTSEFTASDSFRSLLSSKGVVLRENEKLIIIQKR